MTQEQIIVKPRPHNIVRKADKLIRARYSLSAIAIKVITSVIAMIDKNDADFKLYVIKVQDFKELTDAKGKLGGSAYQQLIDACNELMNKKIEFIDGVDVGFMLTRWIASAEYFAGAGEIEIEISQKLRPLLLQLKDGNYLNYELKNILALKSGYVIRLYELLKHEYNKVARYKGHTTATYEINIDEFRNEFKIPDSYQYSSHIKKLIFDKAVKEFKEHTDIEISYEPSRKRGKKVIAVEFTIRDNKSSNKYLKNIRSFINYIRETYEKQVVYEEENLSLYIKNGRLFNKINFQEYNKNQAQEIWEKLYNLALEKKLSILNRQENTTKTIQKLQIKRF